MNYNSIYPRGSWRRGVTPPSARPILNLNNSGRLRARNRVPTAATMPRTARRASRAASAESPQSMTILIQVSPGELIDKMTILEVKLEHMSDPAKLANVRREHDMIKQTFRENVADLPALAKLIAEPKATNLALWTIEDDIRDHER